MRRIMREGDLIETPDPELWEAPELLSVDEARLQVGDCRENGPLREREEEDWAA
ncbi:hypothetical protein ACO2Q1_04100 [Brevundimonas sp. VNH65]|uniref:hypothetical protein n=1 Tax=Brevundimonas sp. VNH65 TaxID=3400917 RepID=UPI003C125B38